MVNTVTSQHHLFWRFLKSNLYVELAYCCCQVFTSRVNSYLAPLQPFSLYFSVFLASIPTFKNTKNSLNWLTYFFFQDSCWPVLSLRILCVHWSDSWLVTWFLDESIYSPIMRAFKKSKNQPVSEETRGQMKRKEFRLKDEYMQARKK